MPTPANPGEREIYIEFVVQGGFLTATAIDSKTGTEATVMGPAGAARAALADAAVRKLKYLLVKGRDGN